MIGLTNDRSIFLSPPELLRSIGWRYRPWGTSPRSLHQCRGVQMWSLPMMSHFPAGPLPEQNLLGEETRRGPEESNTFGARSRATGWTPPGRQPACWEPCPCPASQHSGGIKKCAASRCLIACCGCFRPRCFSLRSCSALSAAVSEWGVRGEPRAVSKSSAECRHHFSQPREEQPHAWTQHHQWQRCALALPVHQQHAPSVVGYPQPAWWKATLVLVYLCICIVSWDHSLTGISLLSSPVYYEGLQDKLAQVRDARAALNALRDEHREKLRRAAEEAERQRQIQLAQKLEIMRQKKQVTKEALPWINRVLRNIFFSRVCFDCRSTWRCKDSWPSSASRSRRRRGRCVWSSRSTRSRWEPKCLLSPCPMPRYNH